MSPIALFLTLGAAYFVLVAYGVVRTRKAGLPKQIRLTGTIAQVLLPPLLMFAVLLTTGSAQLIEGWGVMLIMLLIAGALLAICTDMIARRVLP